MIYLMYTLIGASLAFGYMHASIGFITASVALFILILWLVGVIE